MKWNFQNTTNKPDITGYEEYNHIFKEYNSERYKQSSEEEKERIIDLIFNIYRGKNIFPIRYYNEEGIKKEIQKCIDKEVKWEGNVLNLRFNQGQSLCRYMFPHMQEVIVGGRNNNSMKDRFYDDYKLRRAVEFCMKFDTSCSPSKTQAALRLGGGGVATNFKTMNSQAIYERYCNPNGVILDQSAGFGGRMLGALTSKNNYKYIGVEPCKETYEGLLRLGKYIEEVKGQSPLFKIYNTVSEDFMLKENYVDMAFTSPPYFNLEKYSNEETQSCNKFPDIEDWFIGYVQPSIENAYKMLKKDGYYLVNIADFNLKGKRVEFVDRWTQLAEEVGFTFVEKISMKLVTRRGVGHQVGGKDKEKKEGIFCFKK